MKIDELRKLLKDKRVIKEIHKYLMITVGDAIRRRATFPDIIIAGHQAFL